MSPEHLSRVGAASELAVRDVQATNSAVGMGDVDGAPVGDKAGAGIAAAREADVHAFDDQHGWCRKRSFLSIR